MSHSKTLALLLALAAAAIVVHAVDTSAVPQAAASDKPWFCHDLDCPKFEVLNSTEKYEIRRYEGGKWAATKVESLLYSVGITTGFKRLFNYISGENEGEHKIAMTAPVVTRVTPGDGPFCKSLFSVHFFVPFAFQGKQDSPPEPTNEDVHIENAGSETFAVSQFGGYLVDDYTLSQKADALQDALDKDGLEFNASSFFVAGYDPPFRLQHRHNEIWIRLSGSQSAMPAQPVQPAAFAAV